MDGKYQGPIKRKATKDDPNYDPKLDQVVIEMHSGGEMVVERHEVVNPVAPPKPPMAPAAAAPKPVVMSPKVAGYPPGSPVPPGSQAAAPKPTPPTYMPHSPFDPKSTTDHG